MPSAKSPENDFLWVLVHVRCGSVPVSAAYLRKPPAIQQTINQFSNQTHINLQQMVKKSQVKHHVSVSSLENSAFNWIANQEST